MGDTATEILDIIPKGGRMVIFDSTSILHEVLPTSDRRVVCKMCHFLIFESLENKRNDAYECVLFCRR